MSILIVSTVGRAKLEGIGPIVGLVVLFFISVGLSILTLILRKLILGFNQMAAVIAAILAGMGIGLGCMGLLGSIVNIINGAGVPGVISFGVGLLWVAALGQLLVYLIKVIKEG